MDRVGISFYSRETPDEVRTRYVRPLRTALDTARAGIFSNYLHQVQDGPDEPAEHLLIFEVHDFRSALRLLRTEMERLGPPQNMSLHNLNPSDLPY